MTLPKTPVKTSFATAFVIAVMINLVWNCGLTDPNPAPVQPDTDPAQSDPVDPEPGDPSSEPPDPGPNPDPEPRELDTVQFVEVDDSVIRLEARSRRKWDSPVIVDLDQDGYNDIILNEHTHFVNIYWGNGAGFDETPTELIVGDKHGMSASDFDNNGLMDIMVAQGGGRGGKPSSPLLFEVKKNREIVSRGEISGFVATSGRSLKLIDVNTDGRPDFIYTGSPVGDQVEDGANFLHLNTARSPDGGLSDSPIALSQHLPQSSSNSERVLVTDFDNDGSDDIILYGLRSTIFVASRREGEGFVSVTPPYDTETIDLVDISGISELDFDNDGDFDLLVTREASAVGEQVDYNPRNNRFSIFTRTRETFSVDVNVGERLEFENLQFSGPRFQQLYVGRGANVRALPRLDDLGSEINLDIAVTPRTTGFPEDANVNRPGIYAGYLGDGVWRLSIISRLLDPSSTETNPILGAIAPISVVVNNVTTSPAPNTIRPSLPVLLLENNDGEFRDFTEILGIDVPNETTFSTVGDFNNDGWTDFIVTLRGSGAAALEQGVFLNDRGRRFVRRGESGLIARDFGAVGGQTQTVDFNEDGRLDILWGNERGRWHLFENIAATAIGNYLIVDVGLSPIKQDDPSAQFSGQAHGARVVVEACGQRMVRRVGSGGSYYSSNANTKMHFGLGTCDKAESVVIRWTDGSVARRQDVDANQTLELGEERAEN